eukprot:TRINITY_DN2404_c0_g2_i10.p1 TRINITY_DN2404_c0_g2~~TRINITY_DN2404_c0_g2_i10.p1  ORF type:complete len:436 (+),score=2.70 TRINITY_DN2404_c0_g2_i10:3-1310(+)
MYILIGLQFLFNFQLCNLEDFVRLPLEQKTMVANFRVHKSRMLFVIYLFPLFFALCSVDNDQDQNSVSGCELTLVQVYAMSGNWSTPVVCYVFIAFLVSSFLVVLLRKDKTSSKSRDDKSNFSNVQNKVIKCGDLCNQNNSENPLSNIYGRELIWSGVWNSRNCVFRLIKFPKHITHIARANAYIANVTKLRTINHPHVINNLKVFISKPCNDQVIEVLTIFENYVLTNNTYVKHQKQILTSGGFYIDALIQIASALEYMHHVHVVHGDVRPANIVLDTENEVLTAKLISLFRSCIVDMDQRQLVQQYWNRNRQRDAVIQYDCLYQAPEALDNDKITYKMDVFAFGITMLEYSLLCEHNKMIRDELINFDLDHICESYAPNNIRNIIQRCIDSDSSLRPSMQQVRIELVQTRYGNRLSTQSRILGHRGEVIAMCL